jgi:hypothetical protein
LGFGVEELARSEMQNTGQYLGHLFYRPVFCCPVYKSGWREWLMFQAGFLWNVKMTWGIRHNGDNNSQHFRERPLMAHDKQAFSWKK